MADGLSPLHHKTVHKKAARLTKIEDVPDELLELVFLHLTSPLDLVRAAFTCRRWRQVIAADGFRVLGFLHGVPPSHVVGHYRVAERLHTRHPPSSNPVFVPSSSSPWAGILATRNLRLDFLPRAEYGEFCWKLTDVQGALLLLLEPQPQPQPRLVVCDPLARRYKEIPHSAWLHGCDFLGAFLHGEDVEARLSLSNFRVICVLNNGHHGIARACAFSSSNGSRWTSSSTVVCGNGYWQAMGALIRFAGCNAAGSVAYWTIRRDLILLALDKDATKLSTSIMLDEVEYDALREKRHEIEYAYDLPWPPMIRACLS